MSLRCNKRLGTLAGLSALLAVFFAVCMLVQALLLPSPSDQKLLKKSGTEVDAGHAAQGYIRVKHKASDKKLKLRISVGKTEYTYDLNKAGEFEVFPLQMGDGKYQVKVFQQISGTKYSQASALSFTATLENENLPYLYPNQLINYNESTKAVALADELCKGLSSDKEKTKKIYDYIISHMMYDFMRAMTVKSGYLPDLDQVLKQNMGMCMDLSALMACMLRSQGIPTSMVVGYADNQYHAWNNVWLDGHWEHFDTSGDITKMKVKDYTESARY